MLDRRFIPEEIRTEEELHKLMEARKFEYIAEYLKWAIVNMANLDPVRFALYVKFKANLLKLGLKLTDQEIRDLSIREIAEKLREHLLGEKPKTTQPTITEQELEQIKEEIGTKEEVKPKTEEEAIKEIVTADVSVIEEERESFRKSLLGERFVVRIKKGGQLLFRVTRKGNSAEIIIPSSWDIQIDDRLLLDLYDQRFSSGKFDLPIGEETKEVETGELNTNTEEQVTETEEEPTNTPKEETITEEVNEVESEETITPEEAQRIEKEALEAEESIAEELEAKEETATTTEEPVTTETEEQPNTEETESPDEEAHKVEEISLDTIINKFKEIRDYYKLRSYVMSNLNKFQLLIRIGVVPPVDGGKAKVAGHIIKYALATGLVNGELTLEEVEEALGKRAYKDVKALYDELVAVN